jgi:hypothetical protein
VFSTGQAQSLFSGFYYFRFEASDFEQDLRLGVPITKVSAYISGSLRDDFS